MISIYLIIFLFAVLFMSLFFNRNILSPSNILISGFILAAICNLVIMLDIGSDISITTMSLIILFNVIFTIFSTFSSVGSEKHISNSVQKIEFIDVKKWKVFLVILFQFLAICLFIYKFKQMFGSITPKALASYRYFGSKGLEEYKMPSWVMTFCNIAKLASYVSVYVLINNLYAKKKDKFLSILLTISSLLIIPIPLLNSSRFDLISFFVFFALLSVFFEQAIKKKIGKNFLLVFVILLICFISFSFVGSLIGRPDGSSSGFVYYFGGGIASFDAYINHTIIISKIDGYFGLMSFQNIYKLLNKLYIVGNNYKITLPFTYIKGHLIGNVYTSLMPYYTDFGLYGLVIMPAISGTLYGYVYKYINSVKIHRIKISIFMYFFISYTLVFSSFSEFAFNSILSGGFIINIIIIYFISKFYSD